MPPSDPPTPEEKAKLVNSTFVMVQAYAQRTGVEFPHHFGAKLCEVFGHLLTAAEARGRAAGLEAAESACLTRASEEDAIAEESDDMHEAKASEYAACKLREAAAAIAWLKEYGK